MGNATKPVALETEPDELCKLCGRPARYFVSVELDMLYDFPLAQLTFYLCDSCVEKPQMFRFRRTRQAGADLPKQGTTLH